MNISLKYSYEINYKNVFLSTLAAFLLHLILIPIIDLLPKSPLEEEIEPKIILDLLEEEIVPTPSDNKITKPQLEEIIPPVETLKNIEPIPRVNQAIIEKNTNILHQLSILAQKNNLKLNKFFSHLSPSTDNEEIINEINEQKLYSISSILEIMRNRIAEHDQYGLGEPSIQKLGENRL